MVLSSLSVVRKFPHVAFRMVLRSDSVPRAAPADPPQKFDWPQWQGPDRNAISKEHGLLKTWPKEGPPLAWKAKGVGGGYSAPSIAAGLVFGMGDRGNDEVVWALAEKDGKEAWADAHWTRLQARRPQGKEGPGCTPTVDGELLYALGLGGDLVRLRSADGEAVCARASPPILAARRRPGAIANRPWSTATKSSARPAAKRRPS